MQGITAKITELARKLRNFADCYDQETISEYADDAESLVPELEAQIAAEVEAALRRAIQVVIHHEDHGIRAGQPSTAQEIAALIPSGNHLAHALREARRELRDLAEECCGEDEVYIMDGIIIAEKIRSLPIEPPLTLSSEWLEKKANDETGHDVTAYNPLDPAPGGEK